MATCRRRRVQAAADAKDGVQQQLKGGRGAISIQVVASGSAPADRWAVSVPDCVDTMVGNGSEKGWVLDVVVLAAWP